ncbi:hypothetical protein B1987_02290 [Mycobacterium kansasii]|nr:hypothetical protein B1987_02290 [Mycobacterium kansasii]
MAAEDVVGGFADDGDGFAGGQDEYWGVGVGASDAEVVWAAGVAQGEFAGLVDDVVADAKVWVGLVGGAGFGSGRVGLFGGEWAGVGVVAWLGVVDGVKGIEEGL